MKFASLKLQNFRRFDEFHIDFDSELTVITAPNGQGKTSVLDAAALSLAPFVEALSRYNTGGHQFNIDIEPTDPRYAVNRSPISNAVVYEQVYPATLTASFLDPVMESQRSFTDNATRPRKEGTDDLRGYGQSLVAELATPTTIPVIRYFRSNRRWSTDYLQRPKADSELTRSRTAGYNDCLAAETDFRQFQDWFRAATLAYLQNIQLKVESNIADLLNGIGKAVDEMVSAEGLSGFHYSFVHEAPALVHPDHGPLPVAMLSDGICSATTMAADLAQRCARLNPHLGAEAPKLTPGMVLIDEVDLHLHPAWQQRILPGLRVAFPLVQFIVSTHSPQVLSTTDSEQIRVIAQDGNGRWFTDEPDRQVVGRSSADALVEVMGVSPTPPTEESRKVDHYINLIETGQHQTKEGQALRQELENIYGSSNPVMVRVRQQERFRDFKKRSAPRPPAPNGGVEPCDP
ncbi:AAA family ATPase [Corynebacterium sp. CNCTC7651]|uniref:AAA family ATPase n=1 Tax=Corynebacterium sp. CNCTC7651 TaxID=2815361 RepID=UPI001F2C85D0|nr:AAA family ATPase [Corynebacterium sp. CNCTC7651]UIZ91884.1 AAA family ATPase [Corynebacterium sp. CNCTC7651]